MIRVTACLVLIFISSALGGALQQSNLGGFTPQASIAGPSVSQDPLNVTGSPSAFNYSYTQANLLTGNNSPTILGLANTTTTQFKWLNTVTRTNDNTTIPKSGFRFNITASGSAGPGSVSWTFPIPQFNCKTCSSVNVIFDLFGNLTKGSNVNYTLITSNGAKIHPPAGVPENFTAPGVFPSPALGSLEAGCPEIFCIPVTSHVGYNVTLSFRFGWNTTAAGGMSADVGEIEIASLGTSSPSCSSGSCHFMQQNPSFPDSITHTATISSISYNNTLKTQVQPSNVSTTQLWWHTEVISIFYPVGYNISQIKLNSTIVYRAPPRVPLENDHCAPGTSCDISLLALNITDFSPTGAIRNDTITISSSTPNSITGLTTTSGGVPTRFFTTGDQIGVDVVNSPSIVNATTVQKTGTLNITFSQPLGIITNPITTALGGIFPFGLPADCGTNGNLCAKYWNVTAIFTSGFDLGIKLNSFRIDSLLISFTGTGGSNSVSTQGQLTYGNGSAAAGINATIFAIDRGTPVNNPFTNKNNNPPTSRLFISNVTIINGIFAPGQSLIMFFTIVNPNATRAFNATLTIEHDWPGPQSHNMTTSVYLGLGDGLNDFAFAQSSAITYQATISFTASGVQVVIGKPSPGSPTKTLIMTKGTSPVLPNSPHAGLFKLAVNSTINSRISNTTYADASPIYSPTYGYVSPSFVPSRYLYASSSFTTGSTGNLSQTITSNSLLGAKTLTVFVLARNAFGVVVVNTASTTFTDSTILIASADSIGPVAKGQTATTTLHLTSNSTKITEIINVNLSVQGNGITSPQPLTSTSSPITISPGGSQTIQLSFTAPSNTGTYTLTFSSPEYGGVLTSQTLQVTILQGNLQLLIPVGIGVVAAIIVLGYYLIRERRKEAAPEEVTRKSPSPKPKPSSGGSSPAKSLTQAGAPL